LKRAQNYVIALAGPLLDDLKRWLQGTLVMLSCKSDTVAAIPYALEQ
jgi:hypothetical protein